MSEPRIDSGRRGEAGFTLVEMLVASLVLMLALALAAQLLDESGRILAHSVARARDTWTPLTSEWLRNDLRTATVAPNVEIGDPQDGPLVLAHAFGVAIWHREGATLVRDEVGVGQKKLLDRVEAWQWRLVGPNVVEAEVRFRRASSFIHYEGGGVPRQDVGKVETLHWLVLLRGAGAGSW